MKTLEQVDRASARAEKKIVAAYGAMITDSAASRIRELRHTHERGDLRAPPSKALRHESHGSALSFTAYLARFANRLTVIGDFAWDWRTAATRGADPNRPTSEEFEEQIVTSYTGAGARSMLLAARRAYLGWQRELVRRANRKPVQRKDAAS